MRVVLMAYGSRGDVEPMVGFALRLREFGWDVRVCAPPDFEGLLDAVGLPLVPVWRPLRPRVQGEVSGTAPLPPEDLPRRAAALTASAYEAVASAAEGCDVIVATGLIPAGAGARSVAEKLGVPYVWVAFFPTYLPSPHHPPLAFAGRPFPPGATGNQDLWDLDAENMNALFGEGINTHRASVGQPPVDDVRAHVLTDRPWLAADPALAPWKEPAGLDVVRTGAWFRPEPLPLPDDVEAFLGAGAPPVYVGFGSMPVRDPEEVARVTVEAVRAQGRRVILSGGWADLALADGQEDCFVVGEADQASLFPRLAAVVHHGGAGTTTAAARAGTPQVVIPQIADQPYWADRVAALGIGAAHDSQAPTFGSLSAALATALDAGTRERAAAVARAVLRDGTATAARLLAGAIVPERPTESA
ncbi:MULTISPECIES: glycosyltransferase [unclassified Streptomyces]|uniref:glycosyltransferase n=1 Tax=unclassified Streptomyces TaxID=2593676 RepID=UPI00094015AA|nr:glycosyltransferase [Streptomyces sp. CB02058]OKI93616.1 glycosyl transferase [Streptomyces sp. CB02058]